MPSRAEKQLDVIGNYYHIIDPEGALSEIERAKKEAEILNDMIEKWNKKVHACDEVVILGDLSLGNGQETNEILRQLKGQLCLICWNHDERYLRDKDFAVSRFKWVKNYAEIHNNRRKTVLMYYPIFCYNGQFRRWTAGTPLTYMMHGHIHKETRAMMRKTARQEEARPVPCQLINCFCMYSDYTPLTLEEWVECDQKRRALLYTSDDSENFASNEIEAKNRVDLFRCAGYNDSRLSFGGALWTIYPALTLLKNWGFQSVGFSRCANKENFRAL